LWSDVYTFATTEEIEARFVNRESKREADTHKGTFCKIAEEIYRDDFEIYSCKDRFFIPQFVKRHDGVSSTVLDRLLRYNSDPECFSRADIEYINTAKEMGATCFITSEIKHHVAIYAKSVGMNMIESGHYATERFYIPILAKKIQKALVDAGYEIRISVSEKESSPFID
jgi:hypothetical protein